mmetsp:Transcript_13316/g.38680  ORF Transcript_13316/g.38680 Transcript_13316/m.38680 type:complete len:236 (+) Transcript_13316:167-874(+)
MHGCMQGCMHLSMHGCMCGDMHTPMHGCMHSCMHALLHWLHASYHPLFPSFPHQLPPAASLRRSSAASSTVCVSASPNSTLAPAFRLAAISDPSSPSSPLLPAALLAADSAAMTAVLMRLTLRPVNTSYVCSNSATAAPCTPWLVPSTRSGGNDTPWRSAKRCSCDQLSRLQLVDTPFSKPCIWMSAGKYRLKISANKKPFWVSLRTLFSEWDRSSPCTHLKTSRLSAGVSGGLS